MRSVHAEQAFRRDLKRLQRRGADVRLLYRILTKLEVGMPLPHRARPHLLHGEWQGYWECHIANDWLLVYSFTENVLALVRTGSHADLFE